MSLPERRATMRLGGGCARDRALIGLLAGFLILAAWMPAQAEEVPNPGEAGPGTAVAQEVIQAAVQGLKTAVDLWKSHQFSGLYEWGTAESKRHFSKGQFVELMKNSTRQLQCCWGALQEMKGFLRSPTQVYVQAKLGYQNFQQAVPDGLGPDSELTRWIISSSFVPRTFLMVMQQDHWRMDLSEILYASGYLPESLGFGTRSAP